MYNVKLILYDRDGQEEAVESMRDIPKVDEHIFLRGSRYRVIQVQHHLEKIPSIVILCQLVS